MKPSPESRHGHLVKASWQGMSTKRKFTSGAIIGVIVAMNSGQTTSIYKNCQESAVRVECKAREVTTLPLLKMYCYDVLDREHLQRMYTPQKGWYQQRRPVNGCQSSGPKIARVTFVLEGKVQSTSTLSPFSLWPAHSLHVPAARNSGRGEPLASCANMRCP